MSKKLESLNSRLKEQVREEKRRYRVLLESYSQLERKYEEGVHYDHLTGLGNKILLEKTIGQLQSRHEDSETAAKTRGEAYHHEYICMVVIDIDDFKIINDTKGHDFGDLILKSFSEKLLETTRESDAVFRSSERGDEFIVVMPYSDRESAISANYRFGSALSCVYLEVGEKNETLCVRCSIGYSVQRLDRKFDYVRAIKSADTNMYKSKNLKKKKNLRKKKSKRSKKKTH